MRQGWVIGFFSFYILIWGIILMTTSVAIGSDDVLDVFKALLSPITITNTASGVSAFTSMASGLSNFFTALIGALTLWFPVSGNPIPLVSPSRIWTGDLIWVYYFPVGEIAIGMMVSVVTVLRGVHSS